MDEQTPTFTQYDQFYYTYQTTLADLRLQPFIDAMLQSKPVLFKSKVFYIKRILLTDTVATVVFRVVRSEN
jgi:hypothetical protein